jgi:hypothetical protein
MDRSPGRIRAFKKDLPLRVWEDSGLQIPNGQDREAWLGAWHTDREWLNAVHRTRYSNGVIGIFEQFVREQPLASVRSSRLPLPMRRYYCNLRRAAGAW